jgi:hypothetical protein
MQYGQFSAMEPQILCVCMLSECLYVRFPFLLYNCLHLQKQTHVNYAWKNEGLVIIMGWKGMHMSSAWHVLKMPRNSEGNWGTVLARHKVLKKVHGGTEGRACFSAGTHYHLHACWGGLFQTEPTPQNRLHHIPRHGMDWSVGKDATWKSETAFTQQLNTYWLQRLWERRHVCVIYNNSMGKATGYGLWAEARIQFLISALRFYVHKNCTT